MRSRKRDPCTRHHDEHSGQDQGTGQEQGSDWAVVDEESCPLRALQGRHPGSFTANHGQSKLLLNGSVLRMSCSSQALDTGSIPVTRSIQLPCLSMVCDDESH